MDQTGDRPEIAEAWQLRSQIGQRRGSNRLHQSGADVGYAIPKEGALAWLDCWAITRNARNKRLAEGWINYMLEAGPSEVLTGRHGLDSTTRAAAHRRESDALIWLQPVEDVERRVDLWARIVSGDRLGKVLAP